MKIKKTIFTLGLVAAATSWAAPGPRIDQQEAIKKINSFRNNFKVTPVTPTPQLLEKIKNLTNPLEKVSYFQGPNGFIGIVGLLKSTKAGFIGYVDPEGRWMISGMVLDLQNNFELSHAAAMQFIPESNLGKSASKDVKTMQQVAATVTGTTAYGVEVTAKDLVLMQSVLQNNKASRRQYYLIADMTDLVSRQLYEKLAGINATVRWIPAGTSQAAKGIGAALLGVADSTTALRNYMSSGNFGMPFEATLQEGARKMSQNDALLRKAGVRGLPVLVEVENGKVTVTGGRDAIMGKVSQ